jgi:hypothetical protein
MGIGAVPAFAVGKFAAGDRRHLKHRRVVIPSRLHYWLGAAIPKSSKNPLRVYFVTGQ